MGVLAHVILPGAAPEGKTFQRTRCAADAIGEMINKMTHLGANKDSIEAFLVGGGNVLKRKDDTIGKDNIISVVELLKKREIKIRAKSLGGTESRGISLDVENGSIYYSVGEGIEKLMLKFTEKINNKKCIKEDRTK